MSKRGKKKARRRKGVKNNKARAQRIHAKRRALERFGTTFQYKKAVQMIESGESTFVDSQSLRITRHIVEIDGIEYPVVYDKKRKTIVTVLPKDALKGKGYWT